MNEETFKKQKARYDKLVRKHIGNPNEVTPQKLANALVAEARSGVSKSSWYGLKSAVKSVQASQGYDKAVEKMDKVKWPKDGINTKSQYCKKVPREDYLKLMEAAKGDVLVQSALMLAKYTGMRPEEMHNCAFDEETNTINVIGAKKSEALQRGADRLIKVDDDLAQYMESAIGHLKSTTKEVISHRMKRLTKKTFPRRKAPPTLKSFRHQMGSDLKLLVKQGKMDVKEAAYILGHQSADSMNKYGDVRSACGGLKISTDAETANVRTPSADLEAAIDRCTPAEIMDSGNAWEAGRKKLESEKPQNTKENLVARHSPDDESLDI